MISPIPKYNATFPEGLDYEHEYYFINDLICRKGEKFQMDFKVEIIPENLEIVDQYYTYDRAAREEALEWIKENQEFVYVYWWGPDHKDPEQIENIIVKFRSYEEVSWPDEIAFLRKLRRGPYPAYLKQFARKKLGQLGRTARAFKRLEYLEQAAQKQLLQSPPLISPSSASIADK